MLAKFASSSAYICALANTIKIQFLLTYNANRMITIKSRPAL